MTSLRHLHIGGGESLRSTFDYMAERHRQRVPVQAGQSGRTKSQSKRDKKH